MQQPYQNRRKLETEPSESHIDMAEILRRLCPTAQHKEKECIENLLSNVPFVLTLTKNKVLRTDLSRELSDKLFIKDCSSAMKKKCIGTVENIRVVKKAWMTRSVMPLKCCRNEPVWSIQQHLSPEFVHPKKCSELLGCVKQYESKIFAKINIHTKD